MNMVGNGRGSFGRREIPALVLGSGVTTLGVVRSLGRNDIPRRVGTWTDDLVRSSRWFEAAPELDPEEPDLSGYLRRVELDRAVVIPCSDELAVATANLPDDLSSRFVSFQSDAATLSKLTDKGSFTRVLEAEDIPCPRTHLVDDAEQIASLPRRSEGSLFIKPRDSQAFFRRFGIKGIRKVDADDLLDAAGEVMGEGMRIMVQEYVPGPPSNHYFIDGFAMDGGRIIATLVRRRLRMYPPDFGNSTYMVTVDREEAGGALESLERLLAALEYRGIFSAEFKRDESDGVFRILEINARPWWYVEFAARAGLDVVPMVYEAALGREPSSQFDYEVGRSLVFPQYDLRACRHERGGLLAGMWQFVRDSFGADRTLFAWDDPRPAIMDWRRRMALFLKTRLSGTKR